jgi:AAA15 family ATPase/GTPase
MEKDSTIRVSRKNLERLRRIAALISFNNSQKTNLNDALTTLLDKFDRQSYDLSREETKKEDRKKFLTLLDQPIEGAGPDDYKELEYDD